MKARIIKAGDIANMIRRECGIVITSENEGKTIFSKEELLLLVAYMTGKKQNSDEDFIEKVVEQTLKAQSVH